MFELDLSRHSPLLDPGLHVWGWEVPVYLFLGGLAAGAMVLVPLCVVRSAAPSRWLERLAFAAPVLVSLGMAALFLDLEHKLHAWRFYLAFRWSSPMSWGAWILLLVYPVSLGYALATLPGADAEALAGRVGPLGGLVRRAIDLARRRVGCLRRASVVVGLGLGVYTGILLSALGARTLWASAVLGPLFLASGLSSGAALLLLFPLGDDERATLARIDLGLIAVEAALLGLFVLGHQAGGAAGQAAVRQLTSGAYAPAFWTLVVGAGLAVPAALEALGHRVRPAALAPALVLLGGLTLRLVVVAAGQG